MKAGRVEASKVAARSRWKKGGTYPTAPRNALPMLLPCSLLALNPVLARMAFGCKYALSLARVGHRAACEASAERGERGDQGG